MDQVETQGGTKCWLMLLEQYVKSAVTNIEYTLSKCWPVLSEQYVKSAVTNFESTLSKKDMRLPNSAVPISTSYHSIKDASHKLNVQEV